MKFFLFGDEERFLLDRLRELNKNFDPELKVEAVKGKSFVITDEFLEPVKIKNNRHTYTAFNLTKYTTYNTYLL